MVKKKTIYVSAPIAEATMASGEREFSNRLSRVCDRYRRILKTNSPIGNFTEQEFLMLCDEFKGQVWEPAENIRPLTIYIEDEKHLEALQSKWNVVVASIQERLNSMKFAQIVAMIEAIEIYWSHNRVDSKPILFSEIISQFFPG